MERKNPELEQIVGAQKARITKHFGDVLEQIKPGEENIKNAINYNLGILIKFTEKYLGVGINARDHDTATIALGHLSPELKKERREAMLIAIFNVVLDKPDIDLAGLSNLSANLSPIDACLNELFPDGNGIDSPEVRKIKMEWTKFYQEYFPDLKVSFTNLKISLRMLRILKEKHSHRLMIKARGLAEVNIPEAFATKKLKVEMKNCVAEDEALDSDSCFIVDLAPVAEFKDADFYNNKALDSLETWLLLLKRWDETGYHTDIDHGLQIHPPENAISTTKVCRNRIYSDKGNLFRVIYSYCQNDRFIMDTRPLKSILENPPQFCYRVKVA